MSSPDDVGSPPQARLQDDAQTTPKQTEQNSKPSGCNEGTAVAATTGTASQEAPSSGPLTASGTSTGTTPSAIPASAATSNTSSNTTTTFVPLELSLSADAPGYAAGGGNKGGTGGGVGPACWKCKGAGVLAPSNKGKGKSKDAQLKEPVAHVVCPVCPEAHKGYLPAKVLKTVAPLSPADEKLLEKHGYFIEVPPARKLTHHHTRLLRAREGLEGDADHVQHTSASVLAKLSSFDYRPPETDTPSTYTFSNFLGNYRILQETKGGHRYTTDDIMTAYVAFKHLSPGISWKHLDLGCGNSSVLLQLSYLTRFPLKPYPVFCCPNCSKGKKCIRVMRRARVAPTTTLKQTGIEAREQALLLSKASVLLSYGDKSTINHLRGDFRNLTDENHELRKSLNGTKFSVITGTPPYFEISVKSTDAKSVVTPRTGSPRTARAAGSLQGSPASGGEARELPEGGGGAAGASNQLVASTIVEGGMPSNLQSAPARCEFRGGVEAYILSAAAVMEKSGVFVVCENTLNDERVFNGAAAAGVYVNAVTDVIGVYGKPPLFGVYTISNTNNPTVRSSVTVRMAEGDWTLEYRRILREMAIGCALPSVPEWLNGSWDRHWIKRWDNGRNMTKASDKDVHVIYVQTSYFFVDVRVPRDEMMAMAREGILAFAGVTTVERDLVRWHALVEIGDNESNVAAAGNVKEAKDAKWDSALVGVPDDTIDTGLFTKIDPETAAQAAAEAAAENNSESEVPENSNPIWHEKAVDGSLEEEWEKISSRKAEISMIRAKTGIFVVSGDKFGLADAEQNVFCAGSALTWEIELSATDEKKVGSRLVLCGKREDYEIVGEAQGVTMPDNLYAV
jgi:tRNA1(Val) A37 N6-methylase TrmN6